MQLSKTIAFFSLLFLGFGVVIPDQASLINGGFETGDFSGYTVYYPPPVEIPEFGGGFFLQPIGYAEVGNYIPNGVFQPHGGNYYGVLYEQSFGVPLSTRAPSNISDKITISTNVYVPFGSGISGWSAVLDSIGGGQAAWAKIFNSNGDLVATPWEFHTPATRDYWYVEFPWEEWSWNSTATDWYKLELGMALSVVGDTNFALFDDIRVIPEPSTLLLLGSGLVGLVGFGRKKFRK